MAKCRLNLVACANFTLNCILFFFEKYIFIDHFKTAQNSIKCIFSILHLLKQISLYNIIFVIYNISFTYQLIYIYYTVKNM